LAAVEIWIYDVRTGGMTRLNRDNGIRPAWSPDGKFVSYRRGVGDSIGLVVQAVDGSMPPRVLYGNYNDPVFFPDGRSIAVVHYTPTTNQFRIVRLFLDGSREQVLVDNGEGVSEPSVSADGRWLAYSSTVDRRRELFVTRAAPGGGRVQVSQTGGGRNPRWAGPSGRLYFVSGDRVRYVDLTMSGDVPEFSRSDSLFLLPSGGSFDVTRDGSRFTYVRDGAAASRPVIFTNWLSKIRRSASK
jgi:Tol biopolymer transport system component